MANKTMKLIFKGNASDEVKNGVKIAIGMEFTRLFKQAEEPFQVDRKIGNAILRNYNFFKEFQEPPDDPAKQVTEVPLTLSGLKKLGREKINDLAVEKYGIKNAAALPNLETVAREILKVVQSESTEKTADAPLVSDEKTVDPNKTQTAETVETTADKSSEEKSEEPAKEPD